jgi:hypothetical protein
MKKLFEKLLQFLQLTGKSGSLSLTNIAVIIVLYKLAFAPALTGIDLGTMLLSLLAKAHERHLSQGDGE